jgi:hypothetical protein
VGRAKFAVPDVKRTKQVPSEAVKSMTETAPVPFASIEQFPEVITAELAGASDEKLVGPKVITERVSAKTVARDMRERLKSSFTYSTPNPFR